MDTNGTSPLKVGRNLNGFTAVLISAACELFLIFLLFIDAAFSYLLTRFAHYCKLQTPCILCSRLDHVFGSEKPGFYCNLLCSDHRLEISSLLSCNIHGKLVDERGMCENCFSSHIEESKSNLDMHRPFLGKLNLDLAGCGNSSSKSTFFDGGLSPASKNTRLCLCCNKPWIPQVNSQRLVSLKSPCTTFGNPNVPLPPRLSCQKCLKKIKNKFSSQAASHLLEETGFNPFSHVGYTELNITSESESEVQFSDDENFNNIVRGINGNKKESVVHSAPETAPEKPSNVLASTKQPHAKAHDFNCLAPHVLNENAVCESKDQLADQKSNPPVVPELISLDDIPSSSCVVEAPSYRASLLADFTSNFTEVTVEPPPENSVDVTEASNNENNDESMKVISRSTGAGFKQYLVADDTAMVNSTDGDLSAPNKSSAYSEEKEASVFIPEEPKLICDNGVNLNIKSLSVQNLSGQEIPLSSNNSSPRFGCRSVELQKANETNSDVGQNTQKPVFKERNESLDGNSVNELEGENLVDRLKRQVENDQKCMNALYKELEEERSAYTIAANEAMAMITRLQEEKSALHMDALQYLRMMEEQAEHDIHALEKANDLLAEKEKEIQDLEAELEYYRLHFPEETLVETVPVASSNLENEQVSMENKHLSSIKDDLVREAEVIDNPVLESSWSRFEDEKLYISQSLQNLERKFSSFTHQGTSPFISDGEFIDEATNGGQHQQEFLNAKDTQETSQVEKGNDLLMRKASSLYDGSVYSQESLNNDLVVRKGTSHMSSEGEKGSVVSIENGFVVVEKEISDLNERVKAFETDFKFLQHSLNSLQNGNEGLLFVQEILHELQELRKLGLRSRNISVT